MFWFVGWLGSFESYFDSCVKNGFEKDRLFVK